MPFTKSGGFTPTALDVPLTTAFAPSFANFNDGGVAISIAVAKEPNFNDSTPFSPRVSFYACAVFGGNKSSNVPDKNSGAV